MKTCDKTLDMLPAPPRRGRPVTGRARTAAQRKADQRFRDRVILESSKQRSVHLDSLLNSIAELLASNPEMAKKASEYIILLKARRLARLARSTLHPVDSKKDLNTTTELSTTCPQAPRLSP